MGEKIVNVSSVGLGGPYNPMLRSPVYAQRMYDLLDYLRWHTSVPTKLNEMAILIVGRQWRSQVEWFAHAPLAKKAGLANSIIADLKANRRPASMSPDEELTAAFIDKALQASEGIAGLSAAMRGLIAARTAVMTAVAAIDADMRRMARASAACSRLMTIPGVGQLTALAFVAAIDDPSRIRRSRDVGDYLGLVPRRYQSGEVDYTGGISKCGDRRVRTLLYEAANVMLTRYKGQLKLKDWAFAIAKRSTMRKARVALARRLGIIMHAMLRDGTEFLAA